MHNLPPIEKLLVSGGDVRLALNEQGVTRNGCSPTPDPQVLAYSSSTSSTISTTAIAACTKLYKRLSDAHKTGQGATFYAHEMERIRREFITLCDLDSLRDLELVLGSSGTDTHRLAAEILGQIHTPLFIIMPQESETGSGVKAALESNNAVEVITVTSRLTDGALRPEHEVDREVEALTTQAIAAGKHVLIIGTDVSKTGLIIPNSASILALKKRFASKLDILIDACQFRLINSTVREYLEQGCWLVVTGSKFVTGPAFCAALLIPQATHEYSLPSINYSLLLRFEAALTQLRAFHQLPEKQVLEFVTKFAATIQKHLANNSIFELIFTPDIKRAKQSWDSVPTIFPFLLYRKKSGKLLSNDKMRQIYELLQQDLSQHPAIPAAKQSLAAKRCLIGQPVAYGEHASALRLNLDMRLIVDALAHSGRGADAVIQDALTVLDKTALLAEYLFT